PVQQRETLGGDVGPSERQRQYASGLDCVFSRETTAYKPNTTIEFSGRVCPDCKSTDIARDKSRYDSKLSFDLQISKDGIRKVVTECRAPEHQCRACGTIFKPKAYRQRQRIGHNLLAWGIHQHVSNRTTFANLATTVKECFGLDFGEWEFQRLKSMAA